MLTAVNGRYTISGQTYTIGTEYNSRGEMIKQTYPGGSISDRTYHATGALNELKLDSSTVSTRTYDAGRRLTSDVLGNGITESRTYSNDNLLTAINYSNPSLGNLTYTWDTNKNKKSESIGGVMSGYGFTNAGTTYDDEDRLTGYQRTNGALSQSWNLTSVGDWNSVTTNGTAQSRTHGPTHELLTVGGQTVKTDVKGNITLLPAALSSLASTALGMSWDFDNKLKSVDVGNNSSTDVEFKYDALGRRVARVGSSGSYVYVQSDQQTIADYGVGDAQSSPLYRYVYASYIDEPVVRKGAGTGGTIHYYHSNQQYSITAITTSAGAIAERYAYSAYGEPTILDGSGSAISSSSINNRYSYTGREWDATVGLYHFRARWLSPKTGRFLARDPIGFEDGFNLYNFYAGLNRQDATGLGCRVDFECDLLRSEKVGDNDFDCVYKCKSVKQTLAPLSGNVEPITCDQVPDDLEILYTERVDNLDPGSWIDYPLSFFCKEKKCEKKHSFWKNYIGKGDIPILPKCNAKDCRLACDKGEDIVKFICDKGLNEASKFACEQAVKVLNAGGCRMVCDAICR